MRRNEMTVRRVTAMKRIWKRLSGVLLSICIAAAGACPYGAEALYDSTQDDLNGKLLFPGESIRTESAVRIGPDMTYAELAEGVWTNTDASRAYRVGTYTLEETGESGLTVTPEGYVVKVIGGTSSSDDGLSDTHRISEQVVSSDQGEEGNGDASLIQDLACYPEGSWVRITASDPGDGRTFGHWETQPQVYLEDAGASETAFVMPGEGIQVTAVFAEQATDSEADASGDSENPENPENTAETELPEEEAAAAEGGEENGDAAAAEGGEENADAAPAEGAEAPAEGAEAPAEVPAEGAEAPAADEEIWTDPDAMAEGGEENAEAAPAEGAEVTAEVPAEGAEAPAEITAEDAEAPAEGEEIWTDPDAMAESGEENAEAAPAEAPAEGAEVTAEGAGPDADGRWSVEITGGEGSGAYYPGEVVTVSIPEEQTDTFEYWETDLDTVWFEDAYASTTTFVMPEEAVHVKAVFNDEEDEASQEDGQSQEDAQSQEDGQSQEDAQSQEDGQAPENVGSPENEQSPENAVSPEAESSPEAEELPIEEQVPEDGQLMENEPAPEENAAAGENAEFDIVSTDSFNLDGAEENSAQVNSAATEEKTGINEGASPAEAEADAEEDSLGDEDEEAAAEEDAADDSEEDDEDTDEDIDEGEWEDETDEEDWEDDVDEANESVFGFEETGMTETEVTYDWNMVDDDSMGEADGVDFLPPDVEKSVTDQQLDVQVLDGSGSGMYAPGETVSIQARPAPEGYRFQYWSVLTGNVQLRDAYAPVTDFVMTDSAVQVRAVYELLSYSLTVQNGLGSGSFHKGDVVNITANWPDEGKEFASWSSPQPVINGVDRYYASITMPAADTVVTATYMDGPSSAYNRITGLENDGQYLKGTKLTFTAVGNGPDKENPNPGDFKWVPSAYQIGSVTGGWSGGEYTTSMAISATGRYTLTVTFVKQIFDGNTWTATSLTDQKSVSFDVVDVLAVQTGDTTPVIPLAIAAVAALAVILFIVFRRRRQ